MMFSSAAETEAGEKAAKEEAVVENTTPDYAAGLVSAQVLYSFTCVFIFLCHIPQTLVISPVLSPPPSSFSSSVSDFSYMLMCFSETGGTERESSAVNQLPTSHTQHGSLFLLHSQLRGTARLDNTTLHFIFCFHAC